MYLTVLAAVPEEPNANNLLAVLRLHQGRSREALEGQVLWLVFPESRGNAFHKAFEHVARTGEVRHFEHLYPPWGRWYDNHVYLADDRVWVIARDITHEKQAAQRLDILANASRVFAGAASEARTGFEVIARHVAELIGEKSGISAFIYQQQRYRHFDNVYASIVIIGAVGLFCDQLLGFAGTFLFPWQSAPSPLARFLRGLPKRARAAVSGVPSVNVEVSK